jgi:NAD(P)-dependent dehydrogenase (short-subunit alcohol dehydrogenase family)
MQRPVLPPEAILMTGCSSGIGYRTARHLQDAGYHVIATARKAEDVAWLQGEFNAFQLDLADSDSIHSAFSAILKLCHNRISAVFHNGAFGLPGALEDISRDALRHQFETNVFGTHELNNLLIAHFRQQGHGRIILNSSVLGFAAMGYRGAYNMSKYAIEGMADTLRLELAGSNISVSLIEPGPIESRFRANAYREFTTWVDATHSPHKTQYESMIARLQKEDAVAPFTLPPEAVATQVEKALTSRRPAARYRITKPTKVFWYLKRLLPTRWLDVVLQKAGGGGKR